MLRKKQQTSVLTRAACGAKCLNHAHTATLMKNAERKGKHLSRSEKKTESDNIMLVKCYLRAGRHSYKIRGFPLVPNNER